MSNKYLMKNVKHYFWNNLRSVLRKNNFGYYLKSYTEINEVGHGHNVKFEMIQLLKVNMEQVDDLGQAKIY